MNKRTEDLTITDLQDALVDLINKNGRQAAVSLLNEFEVKKLSDLPLKAMRAYHERVTKLLDQQPGVLKLSDGDKAIPTTVEVTRVSEDMYGLELRWTNGNEPSVYAILSREDAARVGRALQGDFS